MRITAIVTLYHLNTHDKQRRKSESNNSDMRLPHYQNLQKVVREGNSDKYTGLLTFYYLLFDYDCIVPPLVFFVKGISLVLFFTIKLLSCWLCAMRIAKGGSCPFVKSVTSKAGVFLKKESPIYYTTFSKSCQVIYVINKT